MANEAAKVVTLTVGGVQYRVSQAGGLTGGRLLFRGGQTFASALSEGFSAKGIDPTIATIMALVRRMTLADYDWVCSEMASLTQVGIVDEAGVAGPDGRKRVTFVALSDRYDEHFRGRYMAQAEWLRGALETNFGPFVAELQEKMAAFRAKVEAAASPSGPQPAPMDSGGSGGSSPAST